jgi:hypothetical protein
VNTAQLTSGSVVLTTEPDGDDFGIPLVSPTRRHVGEPRTVRGTCRARGGVVVWFTDGTKTSEEVSHRPMVRGNVSWQGYQGVESFA